MEKEKGLRNKFPSELRFDVVSGDWVLIATGRARRPEAFAIEKKRKIKISRKECPFCHIDSQEKPILIFSRGKKIEKAVNWTTIVIPNKYPALIPDKRIREKREGPFYHILSGVGYCELVVSRDHKKTFPDFERWQIKEFFDAYQYRYLDLMKRSFVRYISIFHNHGAEAGASQSHPHSQIITTPLVDVDLKKALYHSKRYFRKNKKCLYCQLNNWERKVKKRIVFENKEFLALCPFASKAAFEVIISPKFHSPYFERITEEQKLSLAEAFQVVMKKLKSALKDPPYNFYLHTAPCDGQNYPFYHWHWTILPKTSIMAGFELGTRIEISTIQPEKAAEYLRKAPLN